jgi:hypothetical protein
MRIKSTVAAFLTIAATTAAACVISAPAASAGTANGCVYPRVCFYLTQADWNAKRPTASYQDITSGFQTLGSNSRGAYAVWNSRNDDGALLRYSNGSTYCLPPNRGDADIRGDIYTGIRIMNSPSCAN